MKKILSVFLALVIFTLSLEFTVVESSAATNIETFSDYLYSEALKYEPNIDVTKYVLKFGWSFDDFKNNVGYALLEKPEMYFVDFTYRVFYDSDGRYYVLFNYLYSKSKKSQMDAKFEAAAKKAASGIKSSMSDAEKALIVHDYIVSNCKYDSTHSNYSAYDCLVSGNAVCQGYSLAYKYVLEKYCGIKCTSVISESQNHVWNYVRINNKWYHVDVTSDDEIFSLMNGTSYDGFGEVYHNNLLMSDDACYKSSELHRDWEVLGGYKKADDKTYDNFFWKGSSSAVVYNNGLYYFVADDPNSPMFKTSKAKSTSIDINLCSYSFKTGKTAVLKTLSSVWYVTRSYSTGKTYQYGKTVYKRSYSKIVLMNNDIYINTAKEIYRYNIKNKILKKVYTLKKGESMQIYGMKAGADGKLKVCYKNDITYKDNYFNLNVSA